MRMALYGKSWSLSCWRTKRLFKRRGYVFEVVDVTEDGTRAWLIETTGCKAVPQLSSPDGWWAALRPSSHSTARATSTAWCAGRYGRQALRTRATGVVRHVLRTDVKTARAATRAANDRRRFAIT